MPLSEAQSLIANSPARFRVACSGRRFGKTHLSIREMAKFGRVPKQNIWYVAPTYKQAKENCWDPLKERLDEVRWIKKTNETDLSIVLMNNTKISLKGAEKPDNLRGKGLDFLVLDEVADIPLYAWQTVLRPMLSDKGRKGHALFIGTPKGRNWFYDIYMRGCAHQDEWRQWKSWHFTTIEGGNVPEEEIEEAMRTMDELTFKQEYLADWVDFEGKAYVFDKYTHTSGKLTYDPEKPIAFCFDFNVSPGIAAICQEQYLPSGEYGTAVIGEVHIPRNSTTIAVCDRILHDWGEHRGLVTCYGDATGGSQGSAKVLGSDWDLIKTSLNRVFGGRIDFNIKRKNPPERNRVNALNSRLKTISGAVRLMVHSERCPNMIRDLEGVSLLEGGSGQIDKKKDNTLSHLTDALGYYIEYEFPIMEPLQAHNIIMPGAISF